MSILPRLTDEDRALLARSIDKTEDQGAYIKCTHRGGGTSYWRYLRPKDLVLISRLQALDVGCNCGRWSWCSTSRVSHGRGFGPRIRPKTSARKTGSIIFVFVDKSLESDERCRPQQ